MKIWTSYYAVVDMLPANYPKISISRIVPEFFANNDDYFWFEKLAPSNQLLYLAKSRTDGNKKPYIEAYTKSVLNQLDPHEVAKHIGHNGILICYEGTDKFCHRHLVAQWLRDAGYDVSEYVV